MLPGPCKPFDYADLPIETAAALRGQAARIRDRMKTTTAMVVEIGRDLMAVRQHLEHGQFGAWVEAECGFSARSAQRYMAAAEFAADKNDIVSHLLPAVVYQLAAKSAPENVVTEVMSRLSAGEVVSAEQVSAALADARHEKREAERKAKEAARAKKRSKRALQQEEQRRRAEEKRKEQEEAGHRHKALSLIEALGEEKARLASDVLCSVDGWLIAQHFQRELNKRESMRVAEEARARGGRVRLSPGSSMMAGAAHIGGG